MLTIKNYLVHTFEFAENSSYCDGNLQVSRKELDAYCLNGIEDITVSFEIARPGESVRILHVTDTVMPSWKEGGSTFPGWSDGEDFCGSGKRHQLVGVAVMGSSVWPGIQEAIIEMSGEGAKYCPFSETMNLVISILPQKKEIEKAKLAKQLNQIVLRAAEFLGKLTEGIREDSEEMYCEIDSESDSELPVVGYFCYIQAQGPLRNVHIKGRNCTDMKPVLLKPEELLDGGIVSGNYIIACQKNPTFFHQCNPVVMNMLERHRKDLIFRNVIVSTESGLLEKKRENAVLAAKLAKENGMDGIVISQEGGGHADVDLMFAAEECEKLGIKTVLLTNELAGPNGDLPPLVASSPVADAIVTNGNNDEVITLQPTERAIGGTNIQGGKFDAVGELVTPLGIMYTATNQLGVGKMCTVAL